VANILWPDVQIATLDLSLRYPGQTVHESIYTGDRQVIARGIGVWEGTLSWPQLGRVDNATEIRAIETFLHQLSGAANTFDIPLPAGQEDRFDLVPNADPDAYMTILTATPTGDQLLARFNRQDGLLLGDYVTIDNKLFQCTSLHGGTNVNLTPLRQISTTSAVTTNIVPQLPVIWSQPFLRARRTESTPLSIPKDVDWWGPVTLAFTQAEA